MPSALVAGLDEQGPDAHARQSGYGKADEAAIKLTHPSAAVFDQHPPIVLELDRLRVPEHVSTSAHAGTMHLRNVGLDRNAKVHSFRQW